MEQIELKIKQFEQQRELIKAIRHLRNYMDYSAIESGFAIPGKADRVFADINELFYLHYGFYD